MVLGRLGLRVRPRRERKRVRAESKRAKPLD
jgi:hypothetical protein